MKKSGQHILIVDDELEIRKIIQEILDDEGFSTATAASAEEARRSIKKRTPDLVFLEHVVGAWRSRRPYLARCDRGIQLL